MNNDILQNKVNGILIRISCSNVKKTLCLSVAWRSNCYHLIVLGIGKVAKIVHIPCEIYWAERRRLCLRF